VIMPHCPRAREDTVLWSECMARIDTMLSQTHETALEFIIVTAVVLIKCEDSFSMIREYFG